MYSSSRGTQQGRTEGPGGRTLERRNSTGNYPKEKWVCPNDRHLALRAKLRMGWSTGQAAKGKRQEALSTAETAAILQVIQRAEELEITEHQRIQKLVNRVHAMKEGARGNGTTSCILCGDSLPLLRSSSTCQHCSKNVCNKCGQDVIFNNEKVWLCKICSETREMWKRSGAWFYRGLPQKLMPSSLGRGKLSPGGKGSSQHQKRGPPKRAHSLLGVDLTNLLGLGDPEPDQGYDERPNRHGSERLSSTTSPSRSRSVSPAASSSAGVAGGATVGPGGDNRSGAGSRCNSANSTTFSAIFGDNNTTVVAGDQTKVFDQHGVAVYFDANQQPVDIESWGGSAVEGSNGTVADESVKGKTRRRESDVVNNGHLQQHHHKHQQQGHVNNNHLHLHHHHQQQQQHSSSNFKKDSSYHDIKGRSPSPFTRSGWKETRLGSNSSISESHSDNTTSSPGHPHQNLSPTSLRMASPFPSSSTQGEGPSPTRRSNRTLDVELAGHQGGDPPEDRLHQGGGATAEGLLEAKRRSLSATNSRDSKDSCDSSVFTSSVEDAFSAGELRNLDPYRDRCSSNTSSICSSTSSISVKQHSNSSQQQQHNSSSDRRQSNEGVLGSIELTMFYDSHHQTLHCTLHQAQDLRKSHGGTVPDPYVKLHLLPGASKSNKLRSRTIPKTHCPEFNETLTYHGITEGDMCKKTLRLLVLDDGRLGNYFLGEARVVLRKVKPHESRRLRVQLQPRVKCDDGSSSGESELGRILLSLRYSSTRGSITVGVVRCAHLPSRDKNGLSDPYVKVQLKPDKEKRKLKTAVKWKNLNPEFHEEFTFEVQRNELPKRQLDVRVYDKDIGRTDDFIGGLVLSHDSRGSELRHWYDVIQYPDRRHDRWHSLRPMHSS